MTRRDTARPRFVPVVLLMTVVLLGAGPGVAYAKAKIGAKDIKSNAVLAKHVRSSAVGASEIRRDAVGRSELRAGAVGAEQIASGAVGRSQLAAEAKVLSGYEVVVAFQGYTADQNQVVVEGSCPQGKIPLNAGYAHPSSNLIPVQSRPLVTAGNVLTGTWALHLKEVDRAPIGSAGGVTLWITCVDNVTP